LRYTVASILTLLLVAVLLVNYTPVQNAIVHKVAESLSKKLKTKVALAHIRIDFLNHLDLQGLYIEGQAHDTLLYAGDVEVRITDWFLFKKKPVIHYIGLKDCYIHLYRTATSNSWNSDFIADAFSTPNSKKDTTAGKPLELDLNKVELEGVRFHMDDKWIGQDLDFDVGELAIDTKGLDINKKFLDVGDILVTNTIVSVGIYKGGKPHAQHIIEGDEFDPTPFNEDKWSAKVAGISLKGCSFNLTMDNKTPEPGHFDQNHLMIRDIEATVKDGGITGDTIHGNVTHLSAHDRCGLAIKNMRSKVTVSPVASICSELYLETNNSKVQNYYAMHYRHFPDFTSYIDSVTMVAHLKDAIIDKRDIEYFAPQLKSLPNVVLHAAGDGKGTVANLAAQHLNITDGNTVLKGSITMKGLPDIYKTYITYTDGELFTTGEGILHYVPDLKNSPNIALEKLTYAYFNGKYQGYIENFAVNGALKTNLGTAAVNIKMDIPGFSSNTAAYSGMVTTNSLQIGILLKQPLFGDITLRENVAGNSFDPDHVQMDIDGTITQFTINGYAYQNIITHGTVAKKQFTGKVLVDDPNLGLEFDGGIDYSQKNLNINATAHLLGSNFKALNLTKDTITASADFDLNCTGSSIDNFSGYAKLFNIDLKRNAHKLALDSIYVRSTGDSTMRLLTIQSNDVVARIKGNYQLSELPASAQFYLSRYLPSYIPTPAKYAPDQALEFTVKTTSIDSILAVAIPLVRGFDSSSITGSFNTTAQKLTLNASVPYGSIGNFHMSNITVTGDGNLNQIALNTNIDNVAVGDSFLNGSLSVTTTIGNDSVGFTIATTTPDTSSSITLNGRILARKDSLFLTMLPSQFYLNQAKWDIAGGSKVVYSNKYLDVQGFAITSGLQRITAATQLQNNDKSILVSTENLDLGQLGTWAGLAAYQPDGRLNGTIKIGKIFEDLYITANIKATDVKLGTDTVGSISIIGNYDGAKKLLSLDPQTGIFWGDASVVASGNISFDTATHERLDGMIQFNNAPVAWAAPFLTGIMSRLSGTVDGSVAFNGASYAPEMSGAVNLQNIGLHLDYTGCNYTIPVATVDVTTRRISFGNVKLLDAYKNTATLTGHFSHNLFRDMKMHLTVSSKKFEALNLSANDNNIFYGNLIAGLDSFTIKGPFNDIKMELYNATPAAKSSIFIPVSSGSDVSGYTYASFKTYGKSQEKVVKKSKNKISISIDASLNDLAEMHIVLDPTTGDEIAAKGNGRIQMDIPPNNDIRMYGVYSIDNGTYTYTYKKLFLTRQFQLQNGSMVSFNGPFASTTVDVNAIYHVKARLADILTEVDQAALSPNDRTDAQTPQEVDVKVKMTGYLTKPELTFDIGLEDSHSQGTIAYRRLMLINSDPQQQVEEVSALLVFGFFITPDVIGGATVQSGAINSLGQALSSSTSATLTNLVGKITGNRDFSVSVKYTNYNYNDPASLSVANRNTFYGGVGWNYFNKRLNVEVGSTSDWGKPTSASTTSSFNITGDFRIQYQVAENSGIRISAFRISDYDVTLDRDITRSGVGIGWRKSFDNFNEFFRGNKYAAKRNEELLEKVKAEETDTTGKKHPGTD
jgi:hypothetical protein